MDRSHFINFSIPPEDHSVSSSQCISGISKGNHTLTTIKNNGEEISIKSLRSNPLKKDTFQYNLRSEPPMFALSNVSSIVASSTSADTSSFLPPLPLLTQTPNIKYIGPGSSCVIKSSNKFPIFEDSYKQFFNDLSINIKSKDFSQHDNRMIFLQLDLYEELPEETKKPKGKGEEIIVEKKYVYLLRIIIIDVYYNIMKNKINIKKLYDFYQDDFYLSNDLYSSHLILNHLIRISQCENDLGLLSICLNNKKKGESSLGTCYLYDLYLPPLISSFEDNFLTPDNEKNEKNDVKNQEIKYQFDYKPGVLLSYFKISIPSDINSDKKVIVQELFLLLSSNLINDIVFENYSDPNNNRLDIYNNLKIFTLLSSAGFLPILSLSKKVIPIEDKNSKKGGGAPAKTAGKKGADILNDITPKDYLYNTVSSSRWELSSPISSYSTVRIDLNILNSTIENNENSSNNNLKNLKNSNSFKEEILLIFGHEDGFVSLWNVNHNICLSSLVYHQNIITKLYSSFNKQTGALTIISGALDGTLTLCSNKIFINNLYDIHSWKIVPVISSSFLEYRYDVLRDPVVNIDRIELNNLSNLIYKEHSKGNIEVVYVQYASGTIALYDVYSTLTNIIAMKINLKNDNELTNFKCKTENGMTLLCSLNTVEKVKYDSVASIFLSHFNLLQAPFEIAPTDLDDIPIEEPAPANPKKGKKDQTPVLTPEELESKRLENEAIVKERRKKEKSRWIVKSPSYSYSDCENLIKQGMDLRSLQIILYSSNSKLFISSCRGEQPLAPTLVKYEEPSENLSQIEPYCLNIFNISSILDTCLARIEQNCIIPEWMIPQLEYERKKNNMLNSQLQTSPSILSLKNTRKSTADGRKPRIIKMLTAERLQLHDYNMNILSENDSTFNHNNNNNELELTKGINNQKEGDAVSSHTPSSSCNVVSLDPKVLIHVDLMERKRSRELKKKSLNNKINNLISLL